LVAILSCATPPPLLALLPSAGTRSALLRLAAVALCFRWPPDSNLPAQPHNVVAAFLLVYLAPWPSPRARGEGSIFPKLSSPSVSLFVLISSSLPFLHMQCLHPYQLHIRKKIEDEGFVVPGWCSGTWPRPRRPCQWWRSRTTWH
jgi:hypothetical protein